MGASGMDAYSESAGEGVPADAFSLDHLRELTLAPLRAIEAAAAEGDDSPEVALEPWERTDIPAKTFKDLEWADLIGHLVRETVSPEGSLLASSLAPFELEGAAMRRMTEVAECQELLARDEDPPLRGLSDIRRALAYATRGGTLVGEDLYAIARNCDVASRVGRYFELRAGRAPYLSAAARGLDACDDLRAVLNHAVEPGGRLSDKASPDLGKLRRAVQNHHDRIRSRIGQLLTSDSVEDHLQDDYYTLREDRYVLPVRSGSKSGVPGIVHGYSSSGQTAFIEPSEMIELNNQLRWAEIALQEEEERILARLTEQVARVAGPLERSSDVLAYLDLVCAMGRLGRRLGGTVPEITEGAIALKSARHPNLWLRFAGVDEDGAPTNETVPNDLVLDEERQVLVVSGPNTGGKTVLLKTLGLCALMARCGMTVPADDGSKMPLFRAIYTDIGDEQSIERDLSTFSGHLTNINTFVDRIDGASLVLLDELFTGTDPMQGAALAVALLEDLTDHGARTVVTTHLESLKTLAFQKDVYANASMGFELESLSPTYQVTYGLPGSSYAIRIASRLGFPERVLGRAHRVLEGEEHQTVEEILAALEDKRAEMEREQRRLRHERDEAEKIKRRFQQKYDSLREREKEMVHKQARKLKAQLDEAQSLIRSRIADLQRADGPSSKKGKGGKSKAESQRDLERLRDELKQDTSNTLERARSYTRPPKTGPKGLARVHPEDLEVGMTVYAHPFKRTGTVVSYSEGDAEAQVQIGALKAKVDVRELYFENESSRQEHARGGSTGGSGRGRRGGRGGRTPDVNERQDSGPVLLPQTSQNTVDLRGMRVDEALEKVELFLDSVYAANQDGAYIIHGHGSGALKRAVRGFLPGSRYVDDFRPGERGEGGDGVTVAFLKREDI